MTTNIPTCTTFATLNQNLNFSVVYADGHCKIGENSLGYSRITDKEGNSLTELIVPVKDLTFLHTPKGVIPCTAVKSTDTPKQQIQFAEIYALLLALSFGLKYNSKIVYTDSQTAYAWSIGNIRTTITDPNKLTCCKIAQNLRREFETKGGSVLKILGKDNPADFGYHNKIGAKIYREQVCSIGRDKAIQQMIEPSLLTSLNIPNIPAQDMLVEVADVVEITEAKVAEPEIIEIDIESVRSSGSSFVSQPITFVSQPTMFVSEQMEIEDVETDEFRSYMDICKNVYVLYQRNLAAKIEPLQILPLVGIAEIMKQLCIHGVQSNPVELAYQSLVNEQNALKRQFGNI